MLPGYANTVPVPNNTLIVDEINAWTMTQGPVNTAPSTLMRCCIGAARIIPMGIVTTVLRITFKATKAAVRVMFLVSLLMVVPPYSGYVFGGGPSLRRIVIIVPMWSVRWDEQHLSSQCEQFVEIFRCICPNEKLSMG